MVLDEIDLHVEVPGHGHHALGGVLHRLRRGGLDALHRLVRVDGGDAAAPALVDGDGGDGGDEVAGEVAQGLVAGDEGHGHAEVPGGVGVDEELAAHDAVEGDVVVAAGSWCGTGDCRGSPPRRGSR